MTLQSRRFFQPEVDSKHSVSEWNRDSDNSTYENLLIVSKLPTLKVRRLRTMAIEVYKILHKESPSYLHDLIKIKDTKYCFRYDNIIEIPSV